MGTEERLRSYCLIGWELYLRLGLQKCVLRINSLTKLRIVMGGARSQASFYIEYLLKLGRGYTDTGYCLRASDNVAEFSKNDDRKCSW